MAHQGSPPAYEFACTQNALASHCADLQTELGIWSEHIAAIHHRYPLTCFMNTQQLVTAAELTRKVMSANGAPECTMAHVTTPSVHLTCSSICITDRARAIAWLSWHGDADTHALPCEASYPDVSSDLLRNSMLQTYILSGFVIATKCMQNRQCCLSSDLNMQCRLRHLCFAQAAANADAHPSFVRLVLC